MKKFIYSVAVISVIGLASCSSIRHTSTTIPVETSITSVSKADLNVWKNKISYTYRPSKAVRRCGEKNVINAAVSEALKANGNADVLVGAQYEVKKTRNIFGCTSIKYVTVTGYPAVYVNVRDANM